MPGRSRRPKNCSVALCALRAILATCNAKTAYATPARAGRPRQNRLLGVAGSPHAGQRSNGAPQSPQNLSHPAADAPHWAHAVIGQLYFPGGIPLGSRLNGLSHHLRAAVGFCGERLPLVRPRESGGGEILLRVRCCTGAGSGACP